MIYHYNQCSKFTTIPRSHTGSFTEAFQIGSFTERSQTGSFTERSQTGCFTERFQTRCFTEGSQTGIFTKDPRSEVSPKDPRPEVSPKDPGRFFICWSFHPEEGGDLSELRTTGELPMGIVFWIVKGNDDI